MKKTPAKVLSILLSVCMVVSLLPTVAFAASPGEAGTILGFSGYEETKEVALGTATDVAALGLPAELTASVETPADSGVQITSVTLPVTWVGDFDGDTPGDYPLTAVWDPTYALGEDVEAPVVTVTVLEGQQPPPANDGSVPAGPKSGGTVSVTTADQLKAALEGKTAATINVTQSITLTEAVTVGADHTLTIDSRYTNLTIGDIDSGAATLTVPQDITLTVQGQAGFLIIANSANKGIMVAGSMIVDGVHPDVVNTGTNTVGVDAAGSLIIQNTTVSIINSGKNNGLEGNVTIRNSTVTIANEYSSYGIAAHSLVIDNSNVIIGSSQSTGVANNGEIRIINSSNISVTVLGGAGIRHTASGCSLLVDNSVLEIVDEDGDGVGISMYSDKDNFTGNNGGIVRLAQGVKISTVNGRFKDQGYVLTATDGITVGTADTSPSADGLTAGDYVWDGEYFTKGVGDPGASALAESGLLTIDSTTATGDAFYATEGWKWDGSVLTLKAPDSGQKVKAVKFEGEIREKVTIKLENDVTLSGIAERHTFDAVMTELVVDAGDYTLTAEVPTSSVNTFAAFLTAGNLRINGGTVVANNNNNTYPAMVSSATLTISGGATVTASSTGGMGLHGYGGIQIEDGCTVTVTGADPYSYAAMNSTVGSITIASATVTAVNNGGGPAMYPAPVLTGAKVAKASVYADGSNPVATYVPDDIATYKYLQIEPDSTSTGASALDENGLLTIADTIPVTDKYDGEGWMWENDILTLKAPDSGQKVQAIMIKGTNTVTIQLKSNVTLSGVTSKNTIQSTPALVVDTGSYTLTLVAPSRTYGAIVTFGELSIEGGTVQVESGNINPAMASGAALTISGGATVTVDSADGSGMQGLLGITIEGGSTVTVTGATQNAAMYLVNGSISIDDSTVTAVNEGEGPAMSPAPVLTDAKVAAASANADGSAPVGTYQPDDIAGYKYLRIEPDSTPPAGVAIDGTNFPDPNFRAWLLDKSNLGGAGADGVLTDRELAGITHMSIQYKEISDLTGLGFFTGLTTLNCSGNQLTTLPQLPSSLQSLSCSSNQLTTLPQLPDSLTYLDCYVNKLVALPALPAGLEYLDCQASQLTALPDLPDSLKMLICSANRLQTLPLLPDSLIHLDCSQNRLTGVALNGSADYFYLDVRYNYLPSEAAVTGKSITWGDGEFAFAPQHAAGFVGVTTIEDWPTTATAGVPLTLSFTVIPEDATNRAITWTVGGATPGVGANITGNTLTTSGPGSVYIVAIIPEGTAVGVDFVAELTITVTQGTGGGGGSGGGSGGGVDSSTPSVTTPKPTEQEPNPATNATTAVKATVNSAGQASAAVSEKSVTDAIQAAQEAAKKAGTTANGITVTIDVQTDKTASGITATLPRKAVEALAAAGVNHLRIQSGAITLTLDLATLKAAQAAGSGNLVLTAAKQDVSKLSQAAQTAIGGRPVFSFSLQSGGKAVTSFGSGSVSFAIPYKLQAGESAGNVQAVYVDGDGKVTWLDHSSYDTGSQALIAQTGHFSVFGVGCKADAPSFTDIAGHWAEEDILFVASRGMMSGTGNSQFTPNGTMTRGMFVTALGRLAGVDSSEYTNTKFTDVKTDAYYAPYAAWAAEKGIVSGTSETTFAPEQSITRQEMAVIMQNYAKALGCTVPRTRDAVTFADQAGIASWAADAVGAMQQAGILNGKDGNKFDPTGKATRAEVAAVLHRYVELVIDPATA